MQKTPAAADRPSLPRPMPMAAQAPRQHCHHQCPYRSRCRRCWPCCCPGRPAPTEHEHVHAGAEACPWAVARCRCRRRLRPRRCPRCLCAAGAGHRLEREAAASQSRLQALHRRCCWCGCRRPPKAWAWARCPAGWPARGRYYCARALGPRRLRRTRRRRHAHAHEDRARGREDCGHDAHTRCLLRGCGGAWAGAGYQFCRQRCRRLQGRDPTTPAAAPVPAPAEARLGRDHTHSRACLAPCLGPCRSLRLGRSDLQLLLRRAPDLARSLGQAVAPSLQESQPDRDRPWDPCRGRGRVRGPSARARTAPAGSAAHAARPSPCPCPCRRGRQMRQTATAAAAPVPVPVPAAPGLR